jgi:hypothetical protein
MKLSNTLSKIVRLCVSEKWKQACDVLTDVTQWRVQEAIVAVAKGMSITYSECVSVVIQHAKRMRRVLLYRICSHVIS